MADVFRMLVWWIYAIGLYMALTICSLMFFRGSPYSYPPTFILFGLGGCAAALVLGIAATLITRATTRQQKLASALLPAA